MDTVHSVNGDAGISFISDDEVAEIGHGLVLRAIMSIFSQLLGVEKEYIEMGAGL